MSTEPPLEIKFSYKHVPTLRKFANSDAFLRCALGPFGSGKSSACAVEMVSRSLAQKPGPDGKKKTRWLVVRNHYRQLNDTTIKTVFQWLPPHHFGTYNQGNQHYLVQAFEGCEIEILFRALDKPSDVANLLSLEITGSWLNEVREIAWPVVEAVQGRVGRYPAQRDGGPSWFGTWMDSNPPDIDSKLYNFFENTQHDPKFAQIFKQPSGLSPEAENLANLPGGRKYYTNMAIGKDPEYVKVYIRGEYGFVIDGRTVFPEYFDATHCSEDIKVIGYEPIYRSWDFGLTPACVFSQLTPEGRLNVFDELVSEDMGVDQFSDEVIAHSTQHYPDIEFIDVGDPAGGQRSQTDMKTCFQILHSKGILIEPGMQSMSIRLESVRRPLTRLVMGKPGFQIHPRCKVLRKAFQGGYQYRRLQTSQERYTAVPDKNQYSHPMDALQYACTRLFGGGLTTANYRGPSETYTIDDHTRSDVTGY